MIFNFKNKKAIIYGLTTSQDGINTLGEKTKRLNDSTIFVKNIVFTTSDPKNPDYYLKTNKAKIVPGKKIITGATNLVIADVPTPLVFPFAYFPLQKTRSSGFIIPSYGESNNQGFFLQNGGYYFAINDYVDLQLTGDIYSNSSWGINANSNYNKRYNYNGNYSFNYDNLITGIEGFSNYSVAKNYNLRWSHNQDPKASPNHKFSAAVNLGSSKYFRQSVNESNSSQSLTNTLSSSVTYYTKFTDTPFNLSVSANHRQNTNTQDIFITLPAVQLNMDRQFPFASKNGIKKNAIQNIGINYSLKGENRIQTTDSEFLTPQMFNNLRNGMLHNVSVSTNLKTFKYFTLAPSATYREVWYFDRIQKNFNTTTNSIVTDTISGFTSFRDYNFGTSLSTTMYGMYKFKNSPLKAIRHTMRPSLSHSYRPDFSYYYDRVPETADHTSYQTYSKYDIGIYGKPTTNITNALGINLANTLEGKLINKEGKEQKINLLNTLNINTNYNFAADSLKLAPLNLTTGTQLFKKLNLNFGTTLDPYALDKNNQRFDKFNINNGGSLFRMTRANFTANYSISSKDLFKKKNKNSSNDTPETTSDEIVEGTPYDQNMFGENIKNTNSFAHDTTSTKTEDNNKTFAFYQSTIPWSLRLSYSTNYNNSIGQREITSSSLMFSGDIELSSTWRVGASSGYDFKNQGFTYTQFRFNKDLKSWNMSFNWVPLGLNSSYYFFIGVKAAVLSELKWDKRSINRSF